MTAQTEGVCTLIQVYDVLESVHFIREHLCPDGDKKPATAWHSVRN
jgi:hypothetical protein